MSWSAIKRNTTDALFSEIVRRRANWTCERCHRNFEAHMGTLDCSHFITRGNKRVRWDFENANCICRGCHQYFGKNPYQHTEFMRKKLGSAALDSLIIRSERKLTDQQIDEKLLRQAFKIELARIEAEEKAKILGAR